jgi:hypothetical protein
MADSVEIRFVDESEFQKEGKWYFWINNSQREALRKPSFLPKGRCQLKQEK